MIELGSADEILTLSFSRKPRNRPLTIGMTVFIAACAFFAFVQRFPESGLILFVVITAVAIAAIGFLAFLPEVTGLIAAFDKANRTIRVVTTRSDGREETTSVGFDQVRTLQLFQQRAKGMQLQTLTLVTTDGRSIFLGEDRQRSGWVSPPFGDGMADIVNRIRREIGVGGIEELPMPIQAAGSAIGVDRR
jgi:hypothetical protein